MFCFSLKFFAFPFPSSCFSVLLFSYGDSYYLYPCLYTSVCLSVCPPVCLSVCQYVSLSVRLYLSLSLQIKYMYFIIYVSTCRMLFFFALLFLVFLCLKVKTGTLRFVIKIVRCKLYSLVKKSHDVLKKCQEFFFFLGNNK